MSNFEILRNEVATTMQLGLDRGESVDEIAADVVHELLEAGTDQIEKASGLLILLRKELK